MDTSDIGSTSARCMRSAPHGVRCASYANIRVNLVCTAIQAVENRVQKRVRPAPVSRKTATHARDDSEGRCN